MNHSNIFLFFPFAPFLLVCTYSNMFYTFGNSWDLWKNPRVGDFYNSGVSRDFCPGFSKQDPGTRIDGLGNLGHVPYIWIKYNMINAKCFMLSNMEYNLNYSQTFARQRKTRYWWIPPSNELKF